MRNLKITMTKLTGPMPRAPLGPQDLGVIHTDVASKLLYRDDAWNKGFWVGVWAGYAAAMLTLGSGVALVMWIGWLS